MAQSCGEELAGLLELTQEDAEEYRRQAQGFTDERLLRMLELFMAVETEMRWASSPRIALEAATMKACLKTKDTDAAALNERIAELEQQLSTLTEQLKNGSFTPAKPAARERCAQDIPRAAYGKAGSTRAADANGQDTRRSLESHDGRAEAQRSRLHTVS